MASDGSGAWFLSAIYACGCFDASKNHTGKAPKHSAKIRVVQFPVDVENSVYEYEVQRPDKVPTQQFHLNLDGTQSECRVDAVDGGEDVRKLFP